METQNRPQWHALAGVEVLEQLGSQPQGLLETEAQRRLAATPAFLITLKPGGHKTMRYLWAGLFWIGVYLLLTLAPLFVLLLDPAPGGSGFWWDLSLALGFAGTAMLGMMFVLTARFKRTSAPFGIDLIYYFHRQISLVALAFILAHPIILLLVEPKLVYMLRPRFLSAHCWPAPARCWLWRC